MCVRHAALRTSHTESIFINSIFMYYRYINFDRLQLCEKRSHFIQKKIPPLSAFFSPNSLDWFQQHRTANSKQQTAKSKTDEIPKRICTILSHTQREREGPRRYTNLSSLVNEFSNLKTMARAIDRDRKNGAWFADRFTYVCLLLMCVVHHSIHLTTFAQT